MIIRLDVLEAYLAVYFLAGGAHDLWRTDEAVADGAFEIIHHLPLLLTLDVKE